MSALTLADPDTLATLLERLARLRPDTQRRWGTLSAREMLCHLADAMDSVLRHRIPPGPPTAAVPRRMVKWLALYSPLPWPKGVPTRPGVDPHREGTKPTDFEQDRGRVVRGLQELASAPAEQLAVAHFRFGNMGRADWQRWGYRHADHHLRQFGI